MNVRVNIPITWILALMAISRPRTCYLSRHALPLSKPCFEISSKVLMREISRVRQLPPGSQDFTPPEVLVEELNRMMGCLEMLIPVYPTIGKARLVRWQIFYTNELIVIGSQLESLREMRTSMQIWTSTKKCILLKLNPLVDRMQSRNNPLKYLKCSNN